MDQILCQYTVSPYGFVAALPMYLHSAGKIMQILYSIAMLHIKSNYQFWSLPGTISHPVQAMHIVFASRVSSPFAARADR